MKSRITTITSAQQQAQQWVAAECTPTPCATPAVSLQRERACQEMLGFGGAFTEAAAYTYSRMSSDRQAEIIKRYFNPTEGLGYTMGRVAIHSCDFALGNYSYVRDGDTSLESFDMSREERWLFPFIRAAEQECGNRIRLLASPWSPPAWMKDSGQMNHGGKLLDEHRRTWADYFVRYIREMQARGFDLWAVTVQNEPEAVQTWDSCIYSAAEECDFVRDFLGPGLLNAGMEDIKLLIWDHNRDNIVERARGVLEDPAAAQFVWGTAFHWYESEEFENVGRVHELFPDKHLLFTEGCQEEGVHLASWATGERYARNMIGDFNNWCEGYLDWNLILDETGGPNHVQNLCDAPMIGDTTTDELHLNSSYYYIGHFSRYIRPGARRLELTEPVAVPTAAFENPGGELVAVLLNETAAARAYSIGPDSENTVCGELAPHSILTIRWDDPE